MSNHYDAIKLSANEEEMELHLDEFINFIMIDHQTSYSNDEFNALTGHQKYVEFVRRLGDKDFSLLNLISPEDNNLLADFNIQSPIVIKNLKGDKGHLIISDNIFESNIGMYGGAIYMHNTELTHVPVILRNNTFSKNTAYFSGNSIFISGCSWIDMSDQVFVNNFGKTTGVGSAVHIEKVRDFETSQLQVIEPAYTTDQIQSNSHSISISNSKFIENFGGVHGSAINVENVYGESVKI